MGNNRKTFPRRASRGHPSDSLLRMLGSSFNPRLDRDKARLRCSLGILCSLAWKTHLPETLPRSVRLLYLLACFSWPEKGFSCLVIYNLYLLQVLRLLNVDPGAGLSDAEVLEVCSPVFIYDCTLSRSKYDKSCRPEPSMAATSSQQSKVQMQTVLFSSSAFQYVVLARNTSLFVLTSSCPVQELHSGNWYSSNLMICLSRYFNFRDVRASTLHMY